MGATTRKVDGDKLIKLVESALDNSQSFGECHGAEARASHLVGGLSWILQEIEPRLGDIFNADRERRTCTTKGGH